MPLDYGDTPEAFSHNVGELIKSGRPRNVAVAIAYRVRRAKRPKKDKKPAGGMG
jgi:hypothetical protein